MPRWKRTLGQSALEIGILLLAHAALIRYMRVHDVVAVIFAAGEHVPRINLIAAMAFLLVRFLAVLALPGMILARAGLVALDAFGRRGRS